MESQIGGAYEKQINFNFPVYYNGEVGKEIRLLNENTVEVVDLLSKREIENYLYMMKMEKSRGIIVLGQQC